MKANKDKHAYELLDGEVISVGRLTESEMLYLENLRQSIELNTNYFDLYASVRGAFSYFRGDEPMTAEIEQSVAFRVALDMVERHGIRSGILVAPEKKGIADDAKLLSMTDAAKVIGVTRAAVHHAVARGKIRAWKVGSFWVCDGSSVERFRSEREGRAA